MYYGEVDIFQEDLDNFLSLAEELELKGLAGSDPPPEEEKQIEVKTRKIEKHTTNLSTSLLQNNRQALIDIFKNSKEINSDSYHSKVTDIVSIDQTEKYSVSGTENLPERINSLIEKINGIWTCKVCGKTPTRNKPSDLSRHAETHLEELSYMCHQCGTVARSSNVMINHVSRKHRA